MNLNYLRQKTFWYPVFFLFSILHFSQVKAQEKTGSVRGKVLNISKQPVQGVSVVITNTDTKYTAGTSTDASGEFIFPGIVYGGSYNLTFSAVGYAPQSVKGLTINDEAPFVLDVSLADADVSLNEVVVVGYGTKKKSDIISSVVTVKPERMTKQVTLDVGEMLRGKATGVFVTTGDAGPGGSSNILIRGRSSISASNSPIVIADGVRIGSINDLNPNDIESVAPRIGRPAGLR